jgi:hypothetical protein
MHDLPGQPDAAAAMGTQAITRIEIPQPIQEPNRSHDCADGRYKKDDQEIVRGTVWENYMLLSTQWPSDFNCARKKASEAGPDPNTDLVKEPDMNCAPAPTFLANSTLETYSQGDSPLASSSCMACHGNATSYQQATRDAETPGPDGKPDFKFFNQTDFTFMLEKAR